MRNQALVVGSIAFDEIFTIRGNIKKEIPLKDGAITDINLMFTARDKKKYFGGTAGNIAYGLGQAGETPLVVSCVGHDFSPYYKEHLLKNKAQLRLFEAGKRKFTATFYGISDEAEQQIGIFQPNAYGCYAAKTELSQTLSDQDFDAIKVAIFSPGTGPSILKHLRELDMRTQGKAINILDPGQELSISFNQEILNQCLGIADLVVVNATELAQLKSLYQITPAGILTRRPRAVIETQGERGVIIHEASGSRPVKSFPARRVREATGAGDAFRAGLIKGLLEDWPLTKATRFGARLGALSVEEFGGQGYSLESDEASGSNDASFR